MYSINRNSRLIGFVATTAMAGALLSGCAATGTTSGNVAAASAETAIAKGQVSRAIQFAETAIEADPRNGAYRATAGDAYLEAGRFMSAATAYNEAIELGETSPRTALSLALAYAGGARFDEAIATLDRWQGEIATADLGLAYALAGQPERAVHVLGNEIRRGGNSVKVRQNLAYSYALAGRWREARLMAAQDVPAGEVDARMEEWAQLTHPLAFQNRIAVLLDIPAGQRDAGMPSYLALANYPDAPLFAAAETGTAVTDRPVVRIALPASSSSSELPALDAPAKLEAPVAAPVLSKVDTPIETSVENAAPVRHDAVQFVSKPVVQEVPARTTTPAGTARVASSAPSPSKSAPARSVPNLAVADPTHLVQLGSFTSEAGAKRAWNIYVSRYPELARHDMVITEAVVRGKRYWRVSAGGYSAATSQTMCARVRSSGGSGCIAWAEARPLPGAVERNRHLARR